MIEWITQLWDGSNWINTTRVLYSYDVYNNIIEETRQSWDGSIWKNYRRVQSEYNGNNDKITDLYQNWDGSEWVNSERFIFTYVANNLVEQLKQIWEYPDNWKNVWRWTYEYDMNNILIKELYQLWLSGNNWYSDSLHTYNYDINNNLVEVLYQNWGGTFWENDEKQKYNYDENNNIIEYVFQYWFNSSWFNYERVFYSYIISSIEEDNNLISRFDLYQNYPNPFNPSTKIEYSVSQTSRIQIKVYDVLGIAVRTLVNEENPVGKYEVEFDGSALPSGIYFYQLKAGNYSETKKMVLLK